MASSGNARFDTSAWNLAAGAVVAVAVGACGPTAILDGETAAGAGSGESGSVGTEGDESPATSQPPGQETGDYYDEYGDECVDGGCDYGCYSDRDCGPGSECVLGGAAYGDCIGLPALPECDGLQLVASPLVEAGSGGGDIVSMAFLDVGSDPGLALGRTDTAELRRAAGGDPVPVPLPGNSGVEELVAADFNGDGLDDLAVHLSPAGLVSPDSIVLLADGMGSFIPSTAVEVPQSTRDIAVLDWDGDGVLDLARATNSGGVEVHRVDSSGMLGVPYDVPLDGLFLAPGNLDGDAFGDLAVLAAAPGSITVAYGSPDGVSGGTGLLEAPYDDSGPIVISIADHDGSGTDEAVTYTNIGHPSINTGHWSLIEVWRDGASSAEATWVQDVVFNAESGDVNGDSIADVVALRANLEDNSWGVVVMLGAGPSAGDTVFSCRTSAPGEGLPSAIAVGNWDGVVGDEIAVAAGGSVTVYTLGR